MAIDEDTVARIATLARIRVPADERAALAAELSGILGWIEQLRAVDTDRVEPMTSVVAVRLPRRPDAVTDGNRRDELLANAPEAVNGFFAVPKVVE